MYISPTPFFSPEDLFFIFGYSDFSGRTWKTAPGDKVLVFSKGRWALEKLVLNLISVKGKAEGTIFVPEYFCEASLLPLRMSGFNLIFYRITSQLEPDIEHLDDLVKKNRPDILLCVHYFGFPLNLNLVAKWCKTNDVLLVEDAAHTLRPISGIGDNGYPVVYTPWKFLNLPEGALLVLPECMVSLLGEPRSQRRNSSCPWKWISKRIVHSMAGYMRLPLHKLRKTRIRGLDESVPLSDPGEAGCSSFFMAVLTRLEKKLEEIETIRERNYRLLDKFLSDENTSAERFFQTLPTKIVPWLYPLRIRNDRCKDVVKSLNSKGIPALPWSDLSPEVFNSSQYPISNTLWREVLTLPVHQNITESQIKFMAREVVRNT